jgi:hypothetical protein
MIIGILPYEEMRAQENRTTKTLTVGVSAVNFDDFGGTIPAFVTQFSIDRGYSPVLGGELAAFTMLMLGGSTAIPDCPPQVPCETRTTPNVLFGIHGSLLARAGDTGLRAALGLGPVWSSGGEGLNEGNSWSGLVGVDWVANSSRRALTLSARLVFLDSKIAGTNMLFLPGIGITF